MQTLNTNKDILIQLHRNHVLGSLDSVCTIRLTGYLSERQVEIQATVQALTHCYLLSIQDDITPVGMNARLDVLQDGEIVYTSDAFILHPTENNSDDDNDDVS